MCCIQAEGQAGFFFFLSSYKSLEACSVAQGLNEDAKNVAF